MPMDHPFLMAGLACLIAALVGGGLNAFGIEIPIVTSWSRQIALGVLGVILITVTVANEMAMERKQERQKALREQQFREALIHEGVRAVDISDPAAPPPNPVGVQLVLRSNPDRADIFFNWVAKGRTPVRLEGLKIAGLLVVIKDGYQPQFRYLNYAESASLPEIILVPEPRRLLTRLLLLAAEGASGESIAALVNHLGQEGFTTLGDQEAREFQQAMLQAGGFSHPALRAWGRAKFNTDLLVTARVRQSSSQVSKQDLGRDIQEQLRGVEQAEVHIALDVQDMRSGDQVIVVTGKGKAFTLDRTQSVQKALTEAVIEVVKKLRLWAHG